MASLAGIQSQVVTRSDHVFLEVMCFDEGQLASYLPKFTEGLHNVSCSEELFENVKT